MNKINFENLPSTNTPLNAQNLNLLQDNVEDAIEEKQTYSTTETRIGTWIDGKPLYRKVIETTSPLVSTDGTNVYKNVSINVNDVDYLFVEKSLLREGNSIYTDNFSNMTGNLNFRIEANPVQKLIVMYCNNTTWSEKQVKIIIQYTKTTD